MKIQIILTQSESIFLSHYDPPTATTQGLYVMRICHTIRTLFTLVPKNVWDLSYVCESFESLLMGKDSTLNLFILELVPAI